MRWLFHVVRTEDLQWDEGQRYRPSSLATEGFVHASYRDVVLESAALYFPAGSDLRVLAIDPRRLDIPVDVAATPRGPMPHLAGAVPRDAVRILELADVSKHADRVRGTRIALVAFEGMTLLDLVGPLDVLSRIASMGFDPTTSCEVVGLTRGEGRDEEVVWQSGGLRVTAASYRPPLDRFDLLVVPGGSVAEGLARDPSVVDYLAMYPPTRMIASVCTGAFLIGATGRLRGRRATTHASALERLGALGAIAVRERVVASDNVITAGGVTAGIDLGLVLVEMLEDVATRTAIAAQIEAAGEPRPPVPSA